MSWTRVCLEGLNSVAWYHWDSSAFVLVVGELVYAGLEDFGWVYRLITRLTWHMPDVTYGWICSIVRPFFTTAIKVTVKVVGKQLSQISPINIRSPALRWGNMLNFLAVCVRRGLRFRHYPWVACMRISYSSMNGRSIVTGWLLLQGLLTLMYSFLTPFWAIPKLSRLVVGLQLHIFSVMRSADKLR